MSAGQLFLANGRSPTQETGRRRSRRQRRERPTRGKSRLRPTGGDCGRADNACHTRSRYTAPSRGNGGYGPVRRTPGRTRNTPGGYPDPAGTSGRFPGARSSSTGRRDPDFRFPFRPSSFITRPHSGPSGHAAWRGRPRASPRRHGRARSPRTARPGGRRHPLEKVEKRLQVRGDISVCVPPPGRPGDDPLLPRGCPLPPRGLSASLRYHTTAPRSAGTAHRR